VLISVLATARVNLLITMILQVTSWADSESSCQLFASCLSVASLH